MSLGKPKNTAAAFVLALVSAGCSFSDGRTFVDLQIEEEEGNRITSGIRYLSACPSKHKQSITGITDPTLPNATTAASSQRSGLLGAALIATASDFLLELVGAGLVAEQQGRNGQFLATGTYLGKEKVQTPAGTQNDEEGCIVIYRGVVGNTAKVAESAENANDELASSFVALGLSAQPAMYMEFVVEKTNDTSKRLLTLHQVEYAASSARRAGSGLKAVTVAIGIGAEASVNSEQTEIKSPEVAEVFRFNLGRLEIGKSYGGDKAVRAIHTAAAQPGTNMVALVTETDRESVALTALIQAFNENKSSIDEALTGTIGNALE